MCADCQQFVIRERCGCEERSAAAAVPCGEERKGQEGGTTAGVLADAHGDDDRAP